MSAAVPPVRFSNELKLTIAAGDDGMLSIVPALAEVMSHLRIAFGPVNVSKTPGPPLLPMKLSMPVIPLAAPLKISDAADVPKFTKIAVVSGE